jgi:2-oxoisovalerate dehydrogenase E1 component
MSKEKKYSIKKTDKETLAKWFKLMLVGRAIDDRAPNYLKQAIGWSYHAPYAGHDGIQLAIGQIFDREHDHLFPYYRDMLTSHSAGLSAEELILNGISRDADVAGGGRHMSNHFAKPEWNIHNVSSCTGNHTLHAVGVARAIKKYKVPGVAISSQGESSVSEGYVYEAINGASNEELPVIFVFQDNGYGISVPKADQTANRKVANNFTGFKNLKIFHCNGKDVFDSMNTMHEAKEYVAKHEHPVIVQANCVRIHSHSNSDRHDLYRDDYELNYVHAYDPLAKFRRLLLRYDRFTEAEIETLENEAKDIVKAAHKVGMNSPNPSPDSIHDFVIPEPYVSEKYPEGLHDHQGEPKKTD